MFLFVVVVVVDVVVLGLGKLLEHNLKHNYESHQEYITLKQTSVQPCTCASLLKIIKLGIECASDSPVSYSAPSLESPLSVRATISLFQSVKNPNFNTVFAYWYSTTGGICNAPMCIDHLNKP